MLWLGLTDCALMLCGCASAGRVGSKPLSQASTTADKRDAPDRAMPVAALFRSGRDADEQTKACQAAVLTQVTD